MLTARALLRWGDLDDARRHAERPALLRSPWRVPLVAGAALTAVVGWRLDGDPRGASRAWLALTMVVHCAVMLGAPARLYWRHDSVLLSRLPIAGDALFDVALVRSLRVTGHALLVCAPPLVLFARASSEAGLRYAAWLAALACASALLVPAAALLGGAMVALGNTTQMTRTVERLGMATRPVRAAIGPRTSRGTEWLGALPGFAMAAIVITTFLCVPWLDGRDATAIGPGWVVVGAIAGASIAAAAGARAIAGGVMAAALRDVVALDRQQLAHLEIHPPTAIERAFSSLVNRRARIVYGKDARLMRRRYPLAYVAGAIGTVVLWILAAARPSDLVPWAAAVIGAMSLYAAALARRLIRPPVERAVTIASLPFAAGDVASAKRAWYAAWLVVYVGLGAGVVIARAEAPIVCAGVIAATVAVAVVLGVRALAAEED